MRRQLTEPAEFKIGAAIADQLELSNYEIEKGPPALPHGGNWSVKP